LLDSLLPLAKSAEEAAGAKLNLLQVQLNSQNQECRQKAAELLAVQEQHTEALKLKMDSRHQKHKKTVLVMYAGQKLLGTEFTLVFA
jgi:hypothetical protein